MIDLGDHAGFIVASYAVTAAVILGLVFWVRAERGRLSRQLQDLEARGVTRRSAGHDG